MRSFILPIAALALALATVACDDAAVETDAAAHDELALAAAPTIDPSALAMCRASATAGMEALEHVLAPAAACEVDADCTIAVAETRCTGEFTVAIGAAAEESFLLLVDKIDARHCAEVAPACTPVAAEATTDVRAVCIAARCQFAE